jgi:hypothetical protein
MDALPQAPRPSFKPKVVVLYEQLFKVRPFPSTTDIQEFVAEGRQSFPFDDFFLLQPHPAQLSAILSNLDGDDFSSICYTTQQFFTRSIAAVRSGDQLNIENVLVVLACVAPLI